MLRIKFWIVIALLLGSTFNSFAQVDRFKAAYMYSICTYVEWPAAVRETDFIVGVLGESGVKSELELLAKRKKIFGQNIVIKEFSSVSSIAQCHVLYISSEYARYLPEIVVKIGTHPTFLISDRKGSIEKGAAINFLMQGNKLKFEIKKDNAIRQRLKVNKTIEKLAVKVY